MRKIIVNSTPLIALAKANKLEILKGMYGHSLRFCNNQPNFSQIIVFLPLASLHESSGFRFSRPQKRLFPRKIHPTPIPNR